MRTLAPEVALGTLLDAKPRMTASGVAFDFWVAVAPAPVSSARSRAAPTVQG